MIVAWKNVCQHCGYVVTTAGDIEYYLDAEGERKIYGHPRAASQEALERGIYGMYDELWCPLCDKVYICTTWAAYEPCKDLRTLWAIGYDLGIDIDPKCPECGNENMLLDLTGLICPHCREGRFKVKEVCRA